MDIETLLGRQVHVVVDRPIGYQHKGMVYPINYGYIPGLMAGDGEEQDAYILGISEPVSDFEGRVIGIIRRKNDTEDKLVVAPEGIVLHQAQIAEAVHFQEQYFDYTIDCLFRKSCGVIPYRKRGDKTEFLLLFQAGSRTWSFPKGHMEPGETELQTALRELFEETGMTASVKKDKKAVLEYNLSPIIKKQVVMFIGPVTGEPAVQQQEIEDFRWVTADQLQNYLLPATCAACKELIASVL